MQNRKLLSLLLTVVLLFAVLPACSGNQPAASEAPVESQAPVSTAPASAAPADGTDLGIKLPLVDTTITFTMWGGTPTAAAGMTDQNESIARQELEKRTNVHIEWTHPVSGQESTSFNLMIASQSYTDACVGIAPYLIGGWDNYIDNGFVMDLTPYTKYMKNYMERRKVSEDCLRDTITDAGRIAFFQDIKKTLQPAYAGPMIRKETLADVGMEVPVTYDDWHNLLKAYKDKGTFKIPMILGAQSGMDMYLMNGYGLAGLMSSFGTLFFQVDGTVHYSPYDPAFKDYLTTMNKWYSEGLIDQDFFTRIPYRDNEAMLLSGEAGCSSGMGYTNLDRYDRQTAGKGVDWYPVEVPKLTADAERRLWVGKSSSYATNATTNLTTACAADKIPVILQYCDYLFTEEGSLLSNFGIEGETYDIGDDGKPHFKDFITNNPDGLSLAVCITKYAIIYGSASSWYDWERELSPGMSEKAYPLAGEKWDASVKDPQIYPTLNLDETNLDEYTAKYTDLDTYVQEMVAKFISGQEPLSNYDAFIAEMEKLGVKFLIQCQQDAYNRYLSRDVNVGY